jgi:hypothetical protein
MAVPDEVAVLGEAMTLVAVCGVTVMVMQRINPDKHIDRYYYNSSAICYTALQLASVLIILCLAINARFLLSAPLRALTRSL